VFVGDERVNRLQMVGQSIVVTYDPEQCAPRYEQTIGAVVAAEIESFVFSSDAQIPIASNQKPMGVGDLVVERIAVPELSAIILIIAIEGVGRLVLEDVEVVYLFFRRRRRRLELRARSRPGEGS